MRAGARRHRLIIQMRIKDPAIGGTDVYQTYATVWGGFRPLSGRELVAAQAENAEISGFIDVCYLRGVRPTMRILCGSRTFEIVAPPIDFDGKRRELQLAVKEII